MASAKSVEDMLTSDVDESAVSALVGSLESQLASPTIHLTSQDISSAHNHVNSISSTENAFVSGGGTNNRIGLASNPTTTNSASGVGTVTTPQPPLVATSTTSQQPPIPIINSSNSSNSTNIIGSTNLSSSAAPNANTGGSLGSDPSSLTNNVKDAKSRIVTLPSTSSPRNNSNIVTVTANNNIINSRNNSNSNVVVSIAAPTSVITCSSNLTATVTAGGNISTATTTTVIPPTQTQNQPAFTVTLPGAIPASGYVNQFPAQANTIGILQRPTIPNGNGPGSITAALTASKGPQTNIQGTAVITTMASTPSTVNVVSAGPKTGPQIRCALPSSPSVNTLTMQNLANVQVRQQQIVIPTSQQTSLTHQTPGIQGHPQTVIAVAKSTASGVNVPSMNMVTQMVSNPQLLQGVQIVNMNTVRGASNPQGPKALAPRVVISSPLRIAGGQQVINARPGAPGVPNTITLPPNMMRGTLFVKTENGQYQLVTTLAPGTTAGTVPGGGTTYRLQTIQPGSHPSVRALASQHVTVALSGHPTNQHIRMQQPQPLVHTVLQGQQQPSGNIVSAGTAISQAPTFSGNSMVSVQSPIAVANTRAGAPTVVTSANIPATSITNSTASSQSASTPQMSPDTAKKKCKNFLSTLIRLASDQPEQVATNVKNLIQGLIDGNVPPEDFTNQLQRELNSSPQPCLIPFLKKSLPYLRHSLTTQELTIEGVRPPPLDVPSLPSTTGASVVTSTASQPTPTTVSQIQVASTTLSRPTLLAHNAQVRLFTTNSAVAGGVAQSHLQHGEYTTVRLAPMGSRLPTVISQSPSIVPHSSPVITQASRPGLPQVSSLSGIQRMPIVRTTTAKTVVMAPSITKMTPSSIIVTTAGPTITTSSATKDKEKKSFSSSLKDDDDINDVAAMGGVNLVEESARIMAQNAEFVGTQIRSCKDENFLFTMPLQRRIRAITAKYGLDEPSLEVTAAISHATQERLKELVEKLAVVAEHRMEIVKSDIRHEVSQDVKGQLKFLEELDRIEKKRHEEQERELLMRAAKSRSKLEDPEQLKLKQKAKEMQRAEMEEMRQRDADRTALLAIGPRKKFKVDPNAFSSNSQQASGSGSSPSSGSSALNSSRPQLLRPRVKRVNLRDLTFVLEQERSTCRSVSLYKMMLK
ncbi:transcription initiation factor TFIID subunit 4 [Chamberlinius hualienensis]